MDVNQPLLARLMEDVEAHFGAYLKRILIASTEYGMFGLPLLDALHDNLPRTRCGDCGACCNAVSIHSIEYHRIVRDLMGRQSPVLIRTLLRRVLRLDQRLAEVGGENRLRCAFRDEEARTCLVYAVRPFACRFFGLKRADGSRDCPHVEELALDPPPLTDERMEDLQAKIMDISETHILVEGHDPIGFFPFEFWAFRFALGPAKALEIYREILVPASTPLTRLWSDAGR